MFNGPKARRIGRNETINRWFADAEKQNTTEAWKQIADWCHGAWAAVHEYNDVEAARDYQVARDRAFANTKRLSECQARHKMFTLMAEGDKHGAILRDHRAQELILSIARTTVFNDSITKPRRETLLRRLNRLTRYRKQFWTPERITQYAIGAI